MEEIEVSFDAEEEFEDNAEEVVKVPPRIELKISNTTLNAEISLWDTKASIEDLGKIALDLLQNSVKIMKGQNIK